MVAEGMVFLFREKRTSIFSIGRLGIGKILRVDSHRGVVHIRIYLQSEEHPQIQINHLPMTIAALDLSIKKDVGIQPGPLDGETEKLIFEWERKFDEKMAAAFNETVFSARDYAIESVAGEPMKVEGSVILSSYPVRGSNDGYTRVETLVGRIAN